MEAKGDDILLTAQDGGISSDRVVSSTYLCTSHKAWRSSIKAMNDEGPIAYPGAFGRLVTSRRHSDLF